MVPRMVVLQKPRCARLLWVVGSGARTLKVAVPPPRSSPRVGLPLSQQKRSQAFQVSPTLVQGGPPSLDGGTGERDSHGHAQRWGRAPRSGTGDQQGLWEPAL